MLEPRVWDHTNTAPRSKVMDSDLNVEIEHVLYIRPATNEIVAEAWEAGAPKVKDGKLILQRFHARCIIPVYGGLERPQLFLCFGVVTVKESAWPKSST